MPLTSNRIAYGIHNITPFRISDGLPYGTLKVLGGGTLTLSAETEELFGGSNKFAWAVEAKTISTDWTANVKSLPDFLFELFLGADVTTTAASALGTVDSLTNVKNATAFDAVVGVATVTAKAGSESDLKDGHFVILAVSATTVDIYALTDLEFKKGVNKLTFENDALKITSAPLAIVLSTATEIPSLGVDLNGGSGAIVMVVGDTAFFKISSAHDGVSTITIGRSSTLFAEHRQLCLGQKRATGDTFELELKRVIGTGFPLPFEEQTFTIPELAMKLVYDEVSDSVAIIRAKKGIAA